MAQGPARDNTNKEIKDLLGVDLPKARSAEELAESIQGVPGVSIEGLFRHDDAYTRHVPGDAVRLDEAQANLDKANESEALALSDQENVDEEGRRPGILKGALALATLGALGFATYYFGDKVIENQRIERAELERSNPLGEVEIRLDRLQYLPFDQAQNIKRIAEKIQQDYPGGDRSLISIRLNEFEGYVKLGVEKLRLNEEALRSVLDFALR